MSARVRKRRKCLRTQREARLTAGRKTGTLSSGGPDGKHLGRAEADNIHGGRATMTDGTVDTSPQLYARVAGVSYLLGALTSVLGQMVVLGMLVVSGSATATAANILSHAPLFRLGF